MGDQVDSVAPDQQQPAENAQYYLIHTQFKYKQAPRTTPAHQELTGHQRLAKIYNGNPKGAAGQMPGIALGVECTRMHSPLPSFLIPREHSTSAGGGEVLETT